MTTNTKEIPPSVEEVSSSSEDKTSSSTSSSSSSSSRALKVLFLSSDTGGGHRASAEALAIQFTTLFPGSTYNIVDILSTHGVFPFNSAVPLYDHLSSHPNQWRLLYRISDNPTILAANNTHLRLRMEKDVQKCIEQNYNPDVVISVHPLMTSIPASVCTKISCNRGYHLPMFIVVTDLGSGHGSWFHFKGIERLFIASEQIRTIAMKRAASSSGVGVGVGGGIGGGGVPEEKLCMVGLPIRHDFALHAIAMSPPPSTSTTTTGTADVNGNSFQQQKEVPIKSLVPDRYSAKGRAHRYKIRKDLLDIHDDEQQHQLNSQPTQRSGRRRRRHRVILVMGGGGGVGKLSPIVNSLFIKSSQKRILCTIVVICARNDALRRSLQQRDWDALLLQKSSNNKYFSSPSPATDDDDDAIASSHHNNNNNNNNGLKNSAQMLQRKVKQALSVGLAKIEPHLPPNVNNIIHKANRTLNTPIPPIPPHEKSSKEEEEEDVVVDDYSAKESKTDSSPSQPTSDSTTLPAEQSSSSSSLSCVKVLPLGYVKQMAEYMVAADVLITKAGPGTIAEAASVGLPIMLTSFLPGQEEGNVEYVVVDKKFGSYCSDSNPNGIADQVTSWLINDNNNNNDTKKQQNNNNNDDDETRNDNDEDDEDNDDDDAILRKMSACAARAGSPFAAQDIVQRIGESVLRWKECSSSKTTKTTTTT